MLSEDEEWRRFKNEVYRWISGIVLLIIMLVMAIYVLNGINDENWCNVMAYGGGGLVCLGLLGSLIDPIARMLAKFPLIAGLIMLVCRFTLMAC